MSIEEKLEQVRQKSLLVSMRIRLLRGAPIIITFVLGIYYTIYWCYTFTGVYQWLAYLQLNLVKHYYVFFTFLLTLIIAWIPTIVCVTVLMIFVSSKRETSDTKITEDKPKRKLATVEKVSILFETRPLFFKIYMMCLIIAVGSFSISIHDFIKYGFISSTPVMIDMATTNIVKEGTSEYITIYAKLSCDKRYREETDGGSSNTSYIPLLDATGKFRKIFLIDRDSVCVDSFSSYTGIVSSGSLPGLIRDKYIDDGLLNIDEKYSVIIQKKPERGLGIYVISISFFSLSLLLDFMVKPFADKNFQNRKL